MHGRPRYGSELFGNLLGMGKSKEAPPAGDTDDPTPLPRQDAIARLKTDFDRFYFVTGQMDLDLYEEDCTFADPFVAFKGRERFKASIHLQSQSNTSIFYCCPIAYLTPYTMAFRS